VPLREYQDYSVDLYSGQLTILNARALLPNANLKIEYEQNDMFNLTTRTLAGLRADYQVLKSRTANAGLGFTIMHYDQSAQVDQVRPGEEPNANTMIGLDGKITWDLPWLTKWIDYLPFYDTKAPSSLSARGEWAITLPDPNKRDSEIYGDDGEPVAYIDNFESVQRNISLSLQPTQWIHSSQPQEDIIGPNDVERAKFRSQLFWFKQFIPDIDIAEVYPNRSTTVGNSKTTALHINFDPSVRGIYNMNPDFVDAKNPKYAGADAFAATFLVPNKDKFWGGMTRMISSFNTNFENDNIEYIEIMMRKNSADGAKMYHPKRKARHRGR
jgi:cell surface protein SprA